MNYASKTTTTASKSRGEIEDILRKAGASRFMTSSSDRLAQIGFEMHGRLVRFDLPFPPKESCARSPKGRKRAADKIDKEWDQECRRLWRCLLLSVKSKLVAISDGISTFDVEFMPFIVVPGGQTVSQWLIPQLEELSGRGKLPALPEFGSSS